MMVVQYFLRSMSSNPILIYSMFVLQGFEKTVNNGTTVAVGWFNMPFIIADFQLKNVVDFWYPSYLVLNRWTKYPYSS